MIYFPSGKPAEISLKPFAGKRVKAWWVNPRDGKPRAIGEMAYTGRKNFTPPSKEDWVLVLDDASRAFPPPGLTPYPLR